MSQTTVPSFHKALFLLAVPMILSNITVPLLGLVDTAVIGHLEHAYYLGGSSVGAMLITSITWLCGFLRMSTTGLSAQSFGANDHRQSLLVLFRGILVAFAIGSSVILLQQPYLHLALSLAGGSDNVQLYAEQYASIRIWGLPAALSNLVILGWLLGTHQAKKVMWVLIFTNLVNLVLDLLFVIGFSWEIKGLALATVMAEYGGFLLGVVIIYQQHGKAILRAKGELWQDIFNKYKLLGYFKLNRDILIRTLCLEICFIFMTFQGARLGDTVVAANAILMNFLLLLSFGLDGIANAAEALIGKAKGEKNRTHITAIVNTSLVWNGIFAVGYSLLFYFLGVIFIQALSSIEGVVVFASEHLIWIIILPIVACWCYLFDGIYIGLMRVSIMRNGMLIATFGCFFPAWFLLRDYGNHGLWAAFLIFMLMRGVTLIWHYQKTKHAV